MIKLLRATRETGIHEVAIAGGVSANSGLREAANAMGHKEGWKVYIPDLQYATDNAAMIAITGYYKFLRGEFSSHGVTPVARIDRL